MASYHEVRRLFADIDGYSCRNKEELSVLKYYFCNKFYDLIEQQAKSYEDEEDSTMVSNADNLDYNLHQVN
jgi:hypothetical protein